MVARQFAKNYLEELRFDSVTKLSSMGVLVKPPKRSMVEEVMPWLMTKIVDFLHEDKAINDGSQNVVIDGIMLAQNEHNKAIKDKYERI